MAKANIWQYSSTAASNTDIDGTDITGSTGLVKNGDNAIRSLMAHLATSEAKGSNVASASTVALGTGRFFHITGTTTITDIDFTDAVDGRWAVLEFDGALTLTHNGTTLTLPGGASITTAAGDRAFIVQDSGDNMHVMFYQPYATGAGPFLPLTGGTLTGNLTVSAVGLTQGQLSFPATQNPSTDANTLDDYEEGTWTPTITFGGSSTGVTYVQNIGTYRKIGSTVFLAFQLQLSNNGSGTGIAFVNGLPFTVSSALNYGMYVYRFQNLSGITGTPFAIMEAGTTRLSVFQSSATTEVQLTDTNITNTAVLYLQGWYCVD